MLSLNLYTWLIKYRCKLILCLALKMLIVPCSQILSSHRNLYNAKYQNTYFIYIKKLLPSKSFTYFLLAQKDFSIQARVSLCLILVVSYDIERRIMRDEIDENLLNVLKLLHIAATWQKSVVN